MDEVEQYLQETHFVAQRDKSWVHIQKLMEVKATKLKVDNHGGEEGKIGVK
jgi:SPX domain protein involved in polyphosphate accumulation